NWRFPRAVATVSKVGPLISVVALMFITGSIVAQNAEAVKANAGRLALAALMLHILGFGVGYIVARILRQPEEIARTISIEVGMQNGGLAAVLAKQNFPMQPLAAVPAIFSAIAQTIVGSIVGTYWRSRPVKPLAEAPVVSSTLSPVVITEAKSE
ncbi:MAG: bile acid:sodium symporter family protein, partial [Verrucomicrobium sp.]